MTHFALTRRQGLIGLAGLAASLSVTVSATGTMAQSAASKTFVLVHGAWHGGWCWHKVIPQLLAQGHRVYAPSLTGLGDRSHLITPETDLGTHVSDIVNLLEFNDLKNVILVGHSYAGMVITGVAAKAAVRIGHLVYLDAFLPEDGMSLNDYMSDKGREIFAANARDHGDGWRLPFDGSFTLEGLGVSDPTDQDWMRPRLTDQPYASFTQAVEVPEGLWDAVRGSYVLCSRRPHYIAMAERAVAMGFARAGLQDKGHDAMVTQPDEVAEVLLKLASA
ncbi:alpha/beta fold hydrolase [Celeribacter persicus]|uniref:Pimeloyl-ACP methyl ester carboxylesterase n=1 Tax=Celeribacter persicus TaxID=1651082 RepID=A0A2T5H5I3_9RHOB|nr:alpha/beta hydrolase [Celeribacter persicus]PTQ66843.1 pimeloyl-ACP methyl ester carboxylesterase [Celeribacter persicus]